MYAISAFTLFSEHLVDALPADPFCYGYGSIYGTPDKLMRDDMDRVLKQEAGQGGRYVSQLDFYFEGKSYLNVFWSDREDSSYETTSGWRHGASPYGTQPFKPSDWPIGEGDVLVRTAALFYNNNLKAFGFEQKLADGGSKYIVIEPFGASEEGGFLTNRVVEDNAYANTIWWTDELTKECMNQAADTELT